MQPGFVARAPDSFLWGVSTAGNNQTGPKKLMLTLFPKVRRGLGEEGVLISYPDGKKKMIKRDRKKLYFEN